MQKIKNLFNHKFTRQIFYFLFIIFSVLFLSFIGNKIFNIGQLLESYELKTYDLRLSMTDKTKKINPDIVIVSIDNASLDFLEEDLGRWPWNRDIYADAINFLTSQGVDLINFDLMFVGYQKGFKDKDLLLAKTLGQHDNVYVSMSMENRSEFEKAPQLPKYLQAEVENQSKTINYAKNFGFNYCNMIFDKIIKETKNIGIINFKRDDDNVSRRCPSFFHYENGYYPYMPFKLAKDYLNKHENAHIDKFLITPQNQLVMGNKKIQLDDKGSMIINWYGGVQTYTYIPFWKVYKSAKNLKNGKKSLFPDDYFKNKIVIIGATANSLYDIKTTPLSAIYPGVEIVATVFNNIIDNDPIKRVSSKTNILICLILGLLVGITVIKISEPIVSTLSSLILLAAYTGFATYILNHLSIWIDILMPIVFSILVFTLMFIVKYVLKSKDFEYTYKLATTDGLTNLFNHRYFQEHLIKCMQKADKENTRFSLILIDIDHFKKFNDTYGHQAGDEVLRQVGQTLRKAVKAHDLVARYGGEEMVIVLDKAHTEATINAAKRICQTVADKEFHLAEGLTVSVTISLGVATYPIDGKTATELIEFADKGLYIAKRNGRNQVGLLPEIQIINNED